MKIFNRNPAAEITAALMPAMGVVIALTMTACSGAPGGSHQAEAPLESQAVPQAAPVCLEGDRQGRRQNDLAEHVYDAAVSRYLLKNASGIGRRVTPESRDYAMMLLADEDSYELCVTAPERCLRMEVAGTGSLEERDALLEGKAAYAYDRALACLQRAGDSWTARMPVPETENIPRLAELYREKILARLVGNMMPAALLSDSSFFGTENQDLYRKALGVMQECLQTLSDAPVDLDKLVERISRDQVAALECLEQMHEQYLDDGEPKGSR